MRATQQLTIPNYRTYHVPVNMVLNYKLPYKYVFNMVWQPKTALLNYRWIEHKWGRLNEILNFILRLIFGINMCPAWIPTHFFQHERYVFILLVHFTSVVVKYLVILRKNVAGTISCPENVARLNNFIIILPAWKNWEFYVLAHFLGVIFTTLLFLEYSNANRKFAVKPTKWKI